jgi:hypothetical protein
MGGEESKPISPEIDELIAKHAQLEPFADQVGLLLV